MNWGSWWALGGSPGCPCPPPGGLRAGPRVLVPPPSHFRGPQGTRGPTQGCPRGPSAPPFCSRGAPHPPHIPFLGVPGGARPWAGGWRRGHGRAGPTWWAQSGGKRPARPAPGILRCGRGCRHLQGESGRGGVGWGVLGWGVGSESAPTPPPQTHHGQQREEELRLVLSISRVQSEHIQQMAQWQQLKLIN